MQDADSAETTTPELNATDERVIRFYITQRRATPPHVLAALANSEDVETRINVAAHPSCPPDTRDALIDDTVAKVRSAALANPAAVQTVVELLEAPGATENLEVQAGAAKNPALPAAHLDSLSTSHIRQIRRSVAANPNSGPRTLAALTSDEDSGVREALAANPSTPVDTLIELAKNPRDVEFMLPYTVAGNESAAPALERLLAAGIISPAAAVENSACPPELIESIADMVTPTARTPLAL